MKRADQLMVMAVAVAVAVIVSACDAGGSTGTDSSRPGDTTGTESSSSSVIAAADRGDCGPPPEDVSWTAGEATELELIGEDGGLEVFAAEYPLPGPTDGLWTQWGQGIALGGGRHLSAVGDELGVDGNSWFFVYDNADRSLTRVFDVQSVVPHQPGAWGYGKIHAQMVADDCGSVWATTYWGSRRDIVYGDGYEGDHLLEIDPAAGTVKDHGAIAGRRGMPALAISTDGHTLVAVAVDAETNTAVLASYDASTDTVLDELDDPRHVGFRSLAVDDTGAVLYSIGGRGLASFSPESNEAIDTTTRMPGDWLRAVTPLTTDGTSYGVTQDDPALFTLFSDGAAEPLGDPRGYTTSLAMTDENDRIFWLPNAHGGAWEVGAKVLAMDTANGEVSELVSLGPMFEAKLGLRAGGTYSIVYDQGRLILGVNASPLNDDSGFGTVVLVVIEGV
jgi:hypothetical protein